ncbi:DUF4303 domain-containing protein [Pseudomonas luteola]|uniref:DUF4303 domain-containing protein n=1 Tax=Pseudomonas luteola TaxID=47886 RepID=UPI001639A06A|nr:DUF4303 domain-containing protein [Pseudomonas luteola]
MINDSEKIFEFLKNAAKHAFLKLKRNHGNEISGFALYSDSGAMSVQALGNSLSNLKRYIEEDGDDVEYYKWSVGEWDITIEQNKFFEFINSALATEPPQISEAGFNDYRNTIFNACVNALSQLKTEGLFKETISEFCLVFSASDYENPEEEIQWISLLNEESKAREFSEWLNSF